MMKKATYGQRAAATLIDLLIIGVVVALLVVIFKNLMVKEAPEVLVNLTQKYLDGTINSNEYLEQLQSLMQNDVTVLAYYNGIQNFYISTFCRFYCCFSAYIMFYFQCFGKTVKLLVDLQ
ncbi:MAG: hypothetical protein L6U99_08220 [Clostridium sp.]|nr:MAG: hypothetical protein L6U99_08220 [Clostridium sp.]